MHQLAQSPWGQTTTTGRSSWRAAMLAAVLACMAFPSAAAAQEPAGALRQLEGTAGCLSQTGNSGACADVRGVDGAQFVTVSPDGQHAYVASVQSNAVAAFSRSESGELQQLAGTDGCVATTAAEGCATGRGLRVPDWITLSSDGANAYVTSAESDATAVFSRDPDTGVLTQLPGAAGCVSSSASELSCSVGRALNLAAGVVLSPDGRNAYVASFISDAIAVFSRDEATGELTQLAGQAGCVSQTVGGCAQAGSMDGLSSVVVSPDGKHVYATARFSKAVTVYARDATTGALTRLAGTDGCVAAVASATCVQANGLPGPNTVVASPDGAHVYVGSFTGSSLAVFSRDPDTGKLTQLPGQQGCFNGDGSQPACAPATALDGTFSLTHGPDGATVYVAAYDSDAVSIFSRDASTGALAQLEGTDGCVSRDGTGGQCATNALLDGAHHVAVDPAGKHAYAPANISDAVSVFDILPGDVEPPDTSISAGPDGPTDDDAPSFEFESTEAGSSFECRLDGPDGAVGIFESCSSPHSHSNLDDGTYTFSVRATDAAGNTDGSPATRSFELDTTVPAPRAPSAPAPPSPAPPRAGDTAGEPSTDGTPGSGAAPELALSLHPRRGLLTVLSRGLPVPFTCASSCDVRVSALVGRRTARRARLSQRESLVLVGRGATRAQTGDGEVRVRFTRDARRRLRRLGRVRVVLRTTVTDQAGEKTTSRRVSLRRYAVPRLPTALRRGLRVWARCSPDCRAEARLVLHGRRARSVGLGRRSVVVASTARALPAGRERAMRLRFSRSARRALARAHRTRLTLWMEVTGPDGQTRAVRRRVVLRR